jgi:hypothetical protein
MWWRSSSEICRLGAAFLEVRFGAAFFRPADFPAGAAPGAVACDVTASCDAPREEVLFRFRAFLLVPRVVVSF